MIDCKNITSRVIIGSREYFLQAGLTGAVVGGISAGIANGIGNQFGHGVSFLESASSGTNWGAASMKAVAHGVSRAAIAKAQGYKTSAAFWSGFAASGFAASRGMGKIGGTMITAAVSGTVSRATGGKFANGAVSGAFIHLFNALGTSDSIASRVAFGNGSPISRSLGRGYDNFSKALLGGISGVNRLMTLQRPNDPMFQMLRYKAVGNSSNTKFLEVQPDLNDLNVQ